MTKTYRITLNKTPYSDDDIFEYFVFGKDDLGIKEYFEKYYMANQLKINGKNYVEGEQKGKTCTDRVVCKWCGEEHSYAEYIYRDGELQEKMINGCKGYDLFCSEKCYHNYFCMNKEYKLCKTCGKYKLKDKFYGSRAICKQCLNPKKAEVFEKTCNACGLPKALDKFYKGKAVCISCYPKKSK